MPAFPRTVPTRQVERDLGVDDLRIGTIRRAAICCCLLAGLVVSYLPAFSVTPIAENWTIAGLLLAVAGLTWYLQRVEPRLAGAALTLGLVLVAIVALSVYPVMPTVFVLPTLVVAAGVFVGPLAALLTSVAAVLILVAVAHPVPTVLPLDTLLLVILLIGANAALIVLSSRPLHAALHWAWQSLEQAQGTIEQLRDSRGELARLSKNLTETCVRLEQLNVELDRARRAAERARRQKAEFAAAVSHELRTPLNLIIGFSEMMTLSGRSFYGERLPESYRDDVEAIYRNAAHISRLVDDILDLSQIEAHAMGLHKEWIDLRAIADEMVLAIGSLFRDKGLYLRFDLADELPEFHADPTRVRQVLLNLLSNAVRFTDEGGVTVSASLGENEIVIEVVDTGVGIAAGDLPLVFREFHKVGSSERGGKGSGLGLAVSKRLVELHGGTLNVESAPGHGSTFRFTLPVNEAVIALPYESGPELWRRLHLSHPNREVIAVVEDGHGEHATRLIQRYVRNLDVVGVQTLSEARRLADDGRLRALLLAAPMADRAVWDEARASFPDLPIVDCRLDGIDGAVRELGVQAYLAKPVSRAQITSALRRVGPVQRILIVDDDAQMVDLLARMIRASSRHYQVWEAVGGAAGLRALAEALPDVVVLDLLMPEVDGYEFIRQMRADERHASARVIVVTARGYEEQTIRVESLGITRAGGLTVGEATRCLNASLAVLLEE